MGLAEAKVVTGRGELMVGLWGILAGVVDIGSFVPLIRGILDRTAMEHRISWLIWAAVAALLFSSQFAKGARASLWLVGGELAGCLVVFVLSLRHGTGKLDRKTIVVLGGVLAALIGWRLTSSATVAVILAVTVNLTAAALTVIKVYRLPGSEPIITWWMFGAGSLINILAVRHGSPVILYVYPVAGAVGAAGVLTASWAGAHWDLGDA
jgi:hypothetical protein